MPIVSMGANTRTDRLKQQQNSQLRQPATLTWRHGPHAILALEKKGSVYSTVVGTSNAPDAIRLTLLGELVGTVRTTATDILVEFAIEDKPLPKYVAVTVQSSTGETSYIIFVFPKEEASVECLTIPTTADQHVQHV